MKMHILIREMRPEDARAFLEIHHSAVRGVAAKDYPPEVIEAWAPMVLSDNAVDFVRANPEGELRLIAEIGGRIVGVAALVVTNAELRVESTAAYQYDGRPSVAPAGWTRPLTSNTRTTTPRSNRLVQLETWR
jgi:hypothetical protein